jgi:secreted PhoX family phosphatase
VLWIQTDMSTLAQMARASCANIGNNQMLACDRQRRVRRFLTGPVGCEVTGAPFTPDGRTMFVNIQHPGETPSERSDPASRAATPTGPMAPRRGRARPPVVIRKADGGVIGT